MLQRQSIVCLGGLIIKKGSLALPFHFFMRHQYEFVCHYPLGCHYIQNSCCHREKHCHREYHLFPVHEEIHSQPYLESRKDECCQHAYPGLEKSCPVCGYAEDIGCRQHYEKDQIWGLLIVSYYFLRAFGTDDCRKAAEEHRGYQSSRNRKV